MDISAKFVWAASSMNEMLIYTFSDGGRGVEGVEIYSIQYSQDGDRGAASGCLLEPQSDNRGGGVWGLALPLQGHQRGESVRCGGLMSTEQGIVRP